MWILCFSFNGLRAIQRFHIGIKKSEVHCMKNEKNPCRIILKFFVFNLLRCLQ